MTTIVEADTGQVLGVVDGRDHKRVGYWLFTATRSATRQPTAWRRSSPPMDPTGKPEAVLKVLGAASVRSHHRLEGQEALTSFPQRHAA
ncbi:hypothetical protein [Arthrobacter sp. FW306-04-A]|uniref:hypothetical protein n=1 Tax=Arthrobacter sp. FW306-04-A TaxID=2879619 RepID=UPI0037C118D9|nr:hypothetical protein LFT43_16330 [Arthrobacter sp. FW306-04-A]